MSLGGRRPGNVPLLERDRLPLPPTLREGREPMVSVTPLSEFVWNPPEFVRCRGRAGVNQVRYSFELRNPRQANICIDKPWDQYFPDNKGRIMHVDSVEKFEGVINSLLSKPLMFIVATSCPARFESLGPINREFVVVVNTSHPSIRQQMKKILKQGLNDCRRGRHFTVEIDFNPAIEDGLRVLMEHAHDYCWQCWTDYHSEAGNIIITNYTSERRRLFMCRNKNDYCRAWFCLPFCLLSWPCYRIKRCIDCKDRRVAIQATISYWLLSPAASLPRVNPIRHLRNTLTSFIGRSGEVEIERACSHNRTIGGLVTTSSQSTQSVTVDLTPPPPPTPTTATNHPLERAPLESEPPPPQYQDIIEQFEPLPLLTTYGMGVFEPTRVQNNADDV